MSKGGRQVERLQLPFRVAFHISMQSVRIRFWRRVRCWVLPFWFQCLRR